MNLGYVYIAITTVLFSSLEIVLKTTSTSFNPIQITLSRFLVGGLVLLPFALSHLKRNELKIKKSDLKSFAMLGFICIMVSMVIYQLAVMSTRASVVAVIFSCNPIFIMIFAYFILREEIHNYNILSLLLEILGTLIIINPLNTKISFKGILFTLLSALIFALYGVLGKKKCAEFGSIVVTCFGFLLGSLEMLTLVFIGRIKLVASLLCTMGLGIFTNVPLFSGYSLSNLPSIAYIFIFTTGIGFACYFKAMEKTSANTTSIIFFFKPILSPILALVVLNETIPINMLIGIIFILSGSIMSIIIPIKNSKKALNCPKVLLP